MDTAAEKQDLRRRMRRLRRELAEKAPTAASELARHLHALPALAAGDVYSLYHAAGSELDPSALRIPQARAALPVAADRDAPLIFRLWTPGDPLEPDAFGIPAPRLDAAEVRPALVFTPVLAFDRRGGRLGQGAGHYDRTIEALRREGPLAVVGVAYAGQELEAVPVDPHDQPLDGILTETGYIPVG